jgi:MFS family permease
VTHRTLGRLVPLFALQVLMACTVGMVPPLLPLLASTWTLSPVQVGLVNTVYAAGRLACSYPTARLRAWRGTRPAIFSGFAGLAVGSVVCGLAPTYPVFLGGRLVMGLGVSAAMFAVFAELLDVTPNAWRGRVANAFEGLAIGSMAIGGVVAAGLARLVGWPGVFLVMAGLVVLGVVAYPWVEPGGAATGAAGRPTPGVRGLARALSVMAPVYVASVALAFTWSGLVVTLAPLVAHERHDLVGPALGLALAAGYVAELAGLVAVSFVIDRVRREPLFLGGAAVVAAGGLGMALAPGPALFIAGLVLVGWGFAIWMIPATVLADRAGTPIPPGHLAVFRIVMDAGMIVGPILLGAVAEVAGDRVAIGAAGFTLLGGALALSRRGASRVV